MMFWKVVKALMAKNGVTQKVLADRCEMSLRTLQGWFSKEIEPSASQAIGIAAALGVTVEYLFSVDAGEDFGLYPRRTNEERRLQANEGRTDKWRRLQANEAAAFCGKGQTLLDQVLDDLRVLPPDQLATVHLMVKPLADAARAAKQGTGGKIIPFHSMP